MNGVERMREEERVVAVVFVVGFVRRHAVEKVLHPFLSLAFCSGNQFRQLGPPSLILMAGGPLSTAAASRGPLAYLK